MNKEKKIKFNKIITIMFALFLFGMSSVQTVEATLADGLQAFYNPESEGSWIDLSGNGKNATPFGGQTGTFFDGSNDYVDIPTISEIMGNNSKTFSIKLKASSIGALQLIIDNFASSGESSEGHILYIEDSLFKSWRRGSGTISTTADTNIDIITVVFDIENDKRILYLNGDKKDELTNTGGMDLNNIGLVLGKRQGLDDSFFLNGNIYNVAIYDRALNASEVTELYNNDGNPPLKSRTKIEQTYSQSQLANIAINDTDWHTITAGNFTITENDTINYGEAIVFATSSTDNMIISCRTNLDGINGTIENKLILQNGSVNSNILLRNNITLSAGVHTIELECKNEIIGNTMIGASVGIGHVMKTVDGEDINYKNYQVNNTVNSGATLTQIGSTTFTTNESLTDNKYILVDWSAQINNTHNQDQTISVYPRIENIINNKNCEQNKQYISAGEFKTIGGLCILKSDELLTNTISLHGTGIATEYKANFNIKELDYVTINETKTNILTGIISNSATFIEKASTTFTSEISNAEVIVKGSISATSLGQDILFGQIQVLDESEELTYQSKDIAMNTNSNSNDITFQTIVPIKSGTNKFKLLLRSDTGNLVTIDSGEINGYVVQKLDIEDSAFDINIFEFWNGTQLGSFSAVVGGATFSTTGTTISAIGETPFQDILINKQNYVSRLYEQHDTTLDLNASIGQNKLNVKTSEKYTNNNINNFTLETEIGNFSTTNGLIILYPFAGIYNWNITTDTYYNKTNEELQVGGSLTEITIPNFIDTILNFQTENATTFYPQCTWNNNNLNQTTGYEIAAQNTLDNELVCRTAGYKEFTTKFTQPFVKNITQQINYSKITINILDRETSQPILLNSTVTIDELTDVTYTTTGQVVFQDIVFKSGTYKVTVDAPGYYVNGRTFTYNNEDDAVVNMYLQNISTPNTQTLYVETFDDFENFLPNVNTKLEEYDNTLKTFKDIAQCTSNSNGACKYIVTLGTKRYRVSGSIIIDGQLKTDVTNEKGEIFQADVAGGQIIEGTTLVRRLTLKTTRVYEKNPLADFYIDYPKNEEETIVEQTDNTTVVNIPIEYMAGNNLVYEVCLNFKINNNDQTLISKICQNASSGVLPTVPIVLNRDFSYVADITVKFDGDTKVMKTYNYVSNDSFFYNLNKTNLVSPFVLILWIVALGISLKLSDLYIYSIATWVLIVAQTVWFPSIINISGGVLIIVISATNIMLGRKQIDNI